MQVTGNRNNGIKIPKHSSGSELFFSLLNKNKQRIDENVNKTNNRTMNKINEQLIRNKEHN